MTRKPITARTTAAPSLYGKISKAELIKEMNNNQDIKTGELREINN